MQGLDIPFSQSRASNRMPIKLAVIVTGLNTGGAELMLLNVLERIGARFTPHVISLSSVGEIGPRIEALGIPVEALGMQPGVPNPFAFLRLVQRLDRLKPDLVHTWMYHADLVGGLAARLARVPTVAWGVHNCNLDPDKTKLSTRAVAGACARLSRWVPDRILSCSEVARQVHVARGYSDEKMVVVPNGFDLVKFRPDESARATVRRELGVAANTPLVGLIGRFDPQKNHSGFFEAVHDLHRRLPAAHFVLAGKGIDGANIALMQMIESSGACHVTHLLGLRNDVPRLMASLDVAASSSHSEAFPNVLGEAMACGVPCAVTDVGDSAYIVGDTGRVVKSGDMSEMANVLEDLLTLPSAEKIKLGERARARVSERFEIGSVVRQYEVFYDALMEVGPRRLQ